MIFRGYLKPRVLLGPRAEGPKRFFDWSNVRWPGSRVLRSGKRSPSVPLGNRAQPYGRRVVLADHSSRKCNAAVIFAAEYGSDSISSRRVPRGPSSRAVARMKRSAMRGRRSRISSGLQAVARMKRKRNAGALVPDFIRATGKRVGRHHCESAPMRKIERPQRLGCRAAVILCLLDID
jgi:hypothetical protein